MNEAENNSLKVTFTSEYLNNIKNNPAFYSEKGLADGFGMIGGKKVKEIVGYVDGEYEGVIGFISGENIEEVTDDELDNVFYKALNINENLHEQKLRKVINNIIREELNENVQKELKSIDKEAEVETIKMKIERIEAAIEKRQNQLSKLDEDEDLKNLTDKKKLKALGKDVKVLEKAKAKLEKTLAKLTGKKKKVLEDTVTEAEGDADDAAELADELERAKEAADALADTELFEDEESMAEIATEAETMFEKLTGRDGGSGKMDEMDALKEVLSQFTENSDVTFIEKHLMDKYDLGNA